MELSVDFLSLGRGSVNYIFLLIYLLLFLNLIFYFIKA